MVESSGSGYGKVIPKRFLERAGFQLRTAESTVPGAGMGLFLEGDVMAGSLVGYFPGKVWLSEHLKRPEDMEKVKKDEKYETMMRFDESIIDSRPFSGLHHPTNPLALCHYINHPPPHSKPNVICLPIDFEHTDDEEMWRFVPNTHAVAPSLLGTVDRSSMMQGMVAMTTRDVFDGEEIFINYRFNPNAIGIPEWYKPVKDGEDEMRWGDYSDI
ncbi:hypothetical protein TrCOL_g5177 [Triparma columacea]|uniref:SET domain-containing protein n=1 Tax=Triparma columacea TaxID=722753 RepID=A0A9W7GQS1_9STRA|nr:hypothetical protein TrCOL_g5177 [Triparma columacea]